MSAQLADQIAAPLNFTTKDADVGVQRLPNGWRVAWDCDIGGPPGYPVRVPLVVLHPAFGVALIGSRQADLDSDQVLTQRLAEARFGAVFAGHLPVLTGTIEPSELPQLVPILIDAFSCVQPLALAGGDAWVATLMRLVVPFDRCWTDNLEGLPLSGSVEQAAQARADRFAWYPSPAAVVPLRRVAALQAEVGVAEQTLPLPEPKAIQRRRWPWALCAVASAFAMVLSLEFFYSGEASAPDVASTSLDGAPALVTAGAPTPGSDQTMDVVSDAARPLAPPAPVEVSLATATPSPVVRSVTSAQTSVAPPRMARIPHPKTARQAQAQPIGTRATHVVKTGSTGRRDASRRGLASGRTQGRPPT